MSLGTSLTPGYLQMTRLPVNPTNLLLFCELRDKNVLNKLVEV